MLFISAWVGGLSATRQIQYSVGLQDFPFSLFGGIMGEINKLGLSLFCLELAQHRHRVKLNRSPVGSGVWHTIASWESIAQHNTVGMGLLCDIGLSRVRGDWCVVVFWVNGPEDAVYLTTTLALIRLWTIIAPFPSLIPVPFN